MHRIRNHINHRRRRRQNLPAGALNQPVRPNQRRMLYQPRNQPGVQNQLGMQNQSRNAPIDTLDLIVNLPRQITNDPLISQFFNGSSFI